LKKLLSIFLLSFLLILSACGSDDKKTEVVENPIEKEVEVEEVEPVEVEEKPSMTEESVANAEENPAKPGAMLYDKTETKFKGMNYHFKGELVKKEKVQGLFDEMQDALLVKNEQGYIMPIFPPYEVTVDVGDEIEVWGPLSGDGYASSDLGVDNVVGMTGAMNAHLININGEMQ
jgi:hypothetical protein